MGGATLLRGVRVGFTDETSGLLKPPRRSTSSKFLKHPGSHFGLKELSCFPGSSSQVGNDLRKDVDPAGVLAVEELKPAALDECTGAVDEVAA